MCFTCGNIVCSCWKKFKRDGLEPLTTFEHLKPRLDTLEPLRPIRELASDRLKPSLDMIEPPRPLRDLTMEGPRDLGLVDHRGSILDDRRMPTGMTVGAGGVIRDICGRSTGMTVDILGHVRPLF